jgi:hypothetical protein
VTQIAIPAPMDPANDALYHSGVSGQSLVYHITKQQIRWGVVNNRTPRGKKGVVDYNKGVVRCTNRYKNIYHSVL